jgi:hypothetical protein
MSDLIITNNNRPVDQSIITQNEAYGNVSNKYIAVPTQEVINIAKEFDNDVKIVGFNRANVRDQEKHGFQKHAVMLEFSNSQMLDGTNMNLVIYNSSDRSTSLKLYAGLLRMVCSNQCVMGDQIMEPVMIKHTNTQWTHTVRSVMENFEEVQAKTNDMIARMLNKYVSYGDQGRFAEDVASVLNKHIKGEIIDPYELNLAHRAEDVGKNVWNMYQRIQYNTMNGGIKRLIKKEDPDEPAKLIDVIGNTHMITDEGLKIKLNKKLNEMAMELI